MPPHRYCSHRHDQHCLQMVEGRGARVPLPTPWPSGSQINPWRLAERASALLPPNSTTFADEIGIKRQTNANHGNDGGEAERQDVVAVGREGRLNYCSILPSEFIFRQRRISNSDRRGEMDGGQDQRCTGWPPSRLLHG